MWCRKLITLCTCVVLLSTDVVHGKYIYQSDVQRSIGQNKVVATWEEAKKHCEDAGAILASPIDEELLKHMLAYIDVNNHTNPYFMGIKAKYNPQPEFYSAEGVLLDDLPEVVLDMIDQLDPRDGDCLAMNRDSIRVVPCWKRYPYICYTKLKINEPEEEKAVKPTEAAPTTESTTKESPTTESTTKESPTTESTNMESPTTESTTKESPTTESTTKESPTIESTTKESPTIKSTTKESPTTESTTKESPTTESTTKESPTTESTTQESPTTESTTKDTKTTEIVAETTIAPECDYEGYKYYPATGRCYHLHTTVESWTNAKKTCNDEGGYLVIVNDPVEALTLANIIKVNYGNLGKLWVGHIDINGYNNWHSIHDDPLNKIYRRSSDFHRLYAKPNRCGLIEYDALLSHGPCFEAFAFVCEKSL